MPTNTTYTGAPIPTSSENPDIPANMLSYASANDDQHVLYATSQANRDALYASVRAGAIVSCPSLGIVWQKTTTPPTAAAWRTLAEIGTPATSGVATAATNFAVSSQWAQRVNGENIVSLSLLYSGTSIIGETVTGTTPGNIGDTTAATLQSAWLPVSAAMPWVFAFTTNVCTGVGTIASGGALILRSTVPSGVIAAGHTIQISVRFPGA